MKKASDSEPRLEICKFVRGVCLSIVLILNTRFKRVVNPYSESHISSEFLLRRDNRRKKMVVATQASNEELLIYISSLVDAITVKLS